MRCTESWKSSSIVHFPIPSNCISIDRHTQNGRQQKKKNHHTSFIGLHKKIGGKNPGFSTDSRNTSSSHHRKLPPLKPGQNLERVQLPRAFFTHTRGARKKIFLLLFLLDRWILFFFFQSFSHSTSFFLSKSCYGLYSCLLFFFLFLRQIPNLIKCVRINSFDRNFFILKRKKRIGWIHTSLSIGSFSPFRSDGSPLLDIYHHAPFSLDSVM